MGDQLFWISAEVSEFLGSKGEIRSKILSKNLLCCLFVWPIDPYLDIEPPHSEDRGVY